MEQKLATRFNDTIAAIATPPGTGGIAVIRISGNNAIPIVSKIWKGKDIYSFNSHTAHLGTIIDSNGEPIDQGVLTIFKGPASFTGEDVIEFSSHGSAFIQRTILKSLIDAGARMADHGEFSQRAFINGNIDLIQAEAIADLIAASSKNAHKIALAQSRGTFSSKLDRIRENLIHLASLLELELDFSEEDVVFADRTELLSLSESLLEEINRLKNSYADGKAYKNGIPVTIAGIPNAGKSTLLNQLLSDNKAIVSDIPGTTRDIIEDTLEIENTLFRFIDTAGLHNTSDPIEQLGIQRTKESLKKASVIIWLIDPTQILLPQINQIKNLAEELKLNYNARSIIAVNKLNLINDTESLEKDIIDRFPFQTHVIFIDAKTGKHIDKLCSELIKSLDLQQPSDSNIIVTNARHYEALTHASEALKRTLEGIENNLSADFIAQDLRETLHYIGTITGRITTDTLLHNIFSHFCIGK